MFKGKSMVSGDRLLIAIGQKYNTQMVLYFVATEDAGKKLVLIIYLSNLTHLLMFPFNLLLFLL